MDEFEQWQAEQDMAGMMAGSDSGSGRQQQQRAGSGGFGDDGNNDIMDPADIPLCNEYAATGMCSAGEDCVYIHGDECEVRV